MGMDKISQRKNSTKRKGGWRCNSGVARGLKEVSGIAKARGIENFEKEKHCQ